MEDIKDKAAEAILSRLNYLLPREMVIELELAYSLRPSITICCTIERIIREHECDDDQEKIIAGLLEKFLQIHFSPKKIDI